MKTLYKLSALSAALCLVLSCASTPKEAPTSPVAEPVKAAPSAATAEEIQSFEAAKARAEKARKSAFDLDAKEFFPEEWNTAEASFVKGQELGATVAQDPSAYKGASASYTAAAEGFEALATKALPLFADACGEKLQKARETAVKAGVPELWASRMQAADAASESAQSAASTGDKLAAIPALLAARDGYLALAAAADAEKVNQEIASRDFSSADTGNFTLATEKHALALSSFDSLAIADSRAAAEESLLRFRLVLKKGFELLAGDSGKKAVAARAEATDAKASVSVPAIFSEAVASQDKADAQVKAEDYEAAATSYADAEKQFVAARDASVEKRAKATAAMEKAATKRTESEKAAKEADAVLEGGLK